MCAPRGGANQKQCAGLGLFDLIDALVAFEQLQTRFQPTQNKKQGLVGERMERLLCLRWRLVRFTRLHVN